MTDSPPPCPNLSPVASVTVSPLTPTIVPASCVAPAPIVIVSPGLKPPPFASGSDVSAAFAPAAPTFV